MIMMMLTALVTTTTKHDDDDEVDDDNDHVIAGIITDAPDSRLTCNMVAVGAMCNRSFKTT